MSEPACLTAAIEYLDRGWVPFPVAPRGKQPLVRWGRLREDPPHAANLREWWEMWPDANVALVTGKTSAIAVIDIDGPHGRASLSTLGPPGAGPVAESARGPHFYCATGGLIVPSAAALAPGVDVRGEGGYVVAPPSLHPTGYRYRRRDPPGDTLPPVPPWVLPATKNVSATDRAPGWVARALRGVPEGERDDTCARLSGYFFAKQCSHEVVESVMMAWNKNNRPPLFETEVLRIVQSVGRKASRQWQEALPGVEGALLELRVGPWATTLPPGELCEYEAICVAEWVRGLRPGAEVVVSYRELETYGGVAARNAKTCLANLTSRGLIAFTSAGRVAGRHGMAARVRRVLPIPLPTTEDGFLLLNDRAKRQDNYLRTNYLKQ